MLSKIHQQPTNWDTFFLSIFVIILTFQPYIFSGQINFFETGLYLPGIQAVLHNEIPYRDFFHLRGPLELYIPAFFMAVFGKHLTLLYLYFYIGTLITLFICILIGRELYRTKYVLFLMVLVLVGRTYPRVVFHIWGGIRYAFGLLTLLMLTKYILRGQRKWVFGAGIMTALGLLTSIEIGVSAMIAVYGYFILRWWLEGRTKKSLDGLGSYTGGIFLILFPYYSYLFVVKAFIPYLDATWTVVTRMTHVFNDRYLDIYPQNAWEMFLAIINPARPNFKHMTPVYLYFTTALYLLYCWEKNKFGKRHYALFVIALYGLMLYTTGFRKLGGSQFEMALQPEKILLFFLLEEFYFYLREKRHLFLRFKRRDFGLYLKLFAIYFLFLGFFMSSVCYGFMRYHKRFFIVNYIEHRIWRIPLAVAFPFTKEGVRIDSLPTLKGIKVPHDQALELQSLQKILDATSKRQEKVFFFPELGAYYFVFDRDFVGRFPMVSLSWLKDGWTREEFEALKKEKPVIAVVPKKLRETFYKQYFKVPSNKKYYYLFRQYIENHYHRIAQTKDFLIYKR